MLEEMGKLSRKITTGLLEELMNIKTILLSFTAIVFSANVFAWQAKVTNILQHGSYAAIYLSPDPGVGNCQYGQPYLLAVDGTPASNQRFSMILAAYTTGKNIAGYPDACSSAIWGQSRPTIERLRFGSN